MTADRHEVFLPIDGLAIAIGYWSGDESRALRLARLIADIEPVMRDDVTLYLVPRHDVEISDEAKATVWHCQGKMKAGIVGDLPLVKTGHPDAPNEMWSAIVTRLAHVWADGHGRPNVFTCEPDGCPVAVDWIDRLKAAHELGLRFGKRVTGALTQSPAMIGPHLNGTLVMHLSMALDRPSILSTPPNQAWDLFHRVAFLAESGPHSGRIINPYGAKGWPDEVLEAMGREVAWISNTKDDSALAWAEANLIHR